MKKLSVLVILLVSLLVFVGCGSDDVVEDVSEYTLTVEVDGNGSVTPEAGEYEYEEGALVDLTAVADDDWGFDGWTGEVNDSEEAETKVLMDENKTVKAVFVEKTYELTVNVEDEESEAFEGATIEVDGEEEITDADGKAIFELANGSYDVKVSADEYYDGEDQVEIDGEDKSTDSIQLEKMPTYDLTVNVQDIDDDAIEGATVEVNGEEKITDGYGEVTFELVDGEYDVKVSADEYADREISVGIDGEDNSADVKLTVVESIILGAMPDTMEVGDEEGIPGVHVNVVVGDDYGEAPGEVNWSSSDDTVIEVEGTTLKAVAEGTATITGEYEGVTASVEVTVEAGSGGEEEEDNGDEEQEAEELPEPETLANAPTKDQADVISLFNSSETYTDRAVQDWNPDWGQGGSLTDATVDGKTVKLLDLVNYQGVAIDEANGIDVSDKSTLHISYWTSDATEILVFPIGGGEEAPINTDTLAQEEWTSLEIDLSQAENVDLEELIQLKFETVDEACVIYLDNIYFY